MRLKILFFVSVFFVPALFSFILLNKDLKLGIYYYYDNNKQYYESLELKEDGIFFHRLKRPFLTVEANGYWVFRNDSLILNSIPQKERLVVWEDFKKSRKKNTIIVRNYDNEVITYHLTVALFNGDTLILNDQFKESVVRDRIKSFCITNTEGVKSPWYIVKHFYKGIFRVKLNNSRIFNNEVWHVVDNKIISRDFNNKEKDYFLSLKQ